MGTDSSQPEPSRTNLYTDLFETLATFRNAENSHHMAEDLVRKARTEVQLVRHLADCKRAVFYDSDGRTLKGYDFDEPGITEADVDTLWWLASDADSWVSSYQDELGLGPPALPVGPRLGGHQGRMGLRVKTLTPPLVHGFTASSVGSCETEVDAIPRAPVRTGLREGGLFE